ncbi:MAG TPA: hypothetical protein VK928_05395 [Longimicrobiales bacterium]|nr:hypothetical protein [Longimicrobiales bacterium]
MLMIAAAVLQEDGLSVGDVIRNLPHDAGALVVYVLVLAFVGFIWHGSRSKQS